MEKVASAPVTQWKTPACPEMLTMAQIGVCKLLPFYRHGNLCASKGATLPKNDSPPALESPLKIESDSETSVVSDRTPDRWRWRCWLMRAEPFGRQAMDRIEVCPDGMPTCAVGYISWKLLVHRDCPPVRWRWTEVEDGTETGGSGQVWLPGASSSPIERPIEGRLLTLGERAVSVVGRGGVSVSSVVGRGGVSVSSVATVGGHAGHVGNVGSAADQQVSAALDMRGLGGVGVDDRGRVVSVSAVVGRGRGGVSSMVGRGRGGVSSVVSRGGVSVRLRGLVLGRWVVGHGSDNDDGQDDCGNNGFCQRAFGGL
uniref:Uncharacterized protein n=1 Tax=Anopheles atroparvus TaxID=41427 RepID=A0A182JGX2_ANOAO